MTLPTTQSIRFAREWAKAKGMTPQDACSFSRYYVGLGNPQKYYEEARLEWRGHRDNQDDHLSQLGIGDRVTADHFGNSVEFRIIDYRLPRSGEYWLSNHRLGGGRRAQPLAVRASGDYEPANGAKLIIIETGRRVST